MGVAGIEPANVTPLHENDLRNLPKTSYVEFDAVPSGMTRETWSALPPSVRAEIVAALQKTNPSPPERSHVGNTRGGEPWERNDDHEPQPDS